MRFFTTAFLFFIAGPCFALEIPTAHMVAIYRGNSAPRIVNLESFEKWKSIFSRTPHRHLNPEHKIYEFEGVSLKDLLELKRRDSALSVHFVGSDGYIASVPASVLMKTDAILALRQNGKPLFDTNGGAQVIFPTEGPRAVEKRYAQKAAFWCWYVRSITVGELPNALPSRLASLQKTATHFDFVPPSTFQFVKTHCPATVRVPLAKVFSSATLTLETLSGERKEVHADNFDLILPTSRAPLPISCGGPLALVDRTKLASASHQVFARDLDLSIVRIKEAL